MTALPAAWPIALGLFCGMILLGSAAVIWAAACRAADWLIPDIPEDGALCHACEDGYGPCRCTEGDCLKPGCQWMIWATLYDDRRFRAALNGLLDGDGRHG